MTERGNSIIACQPTQIRSKRLWALMQLKAQRQILWTGVIGLAALTVALGGALFYSAASPEAVKLGGGEASYYGNELAGNPTASGETFDPNQLTAAHRTLPLGSRVRVTNFRNGESVVVRINDRGPFHGNRVIDLSTAAASSIGLLRSGTGRVSLALLVN